MYEQKMKKTDLNTLVSRTFDRATQQFRFYCRLLCVGLTTLAATACSQSSDTVAPVSSDQPLVTGAPEVGRIQSKGGTKIAVLVNKQPITTNQINRRAAFVRLRRMKGNSRTIATNELIDEAVKMQEARRYGAVASDAEVNNAYAGFAKSNKMSVSQMNSMMAQSGVTTRGFKDYIRASMSWQRLVAGRSQSQSGGSASGPSWLPAAGSQSNKTTEYTIQQIVFIVPASKQQALLPKRRLEANRFRTQVNGCANSKQLAAGLKDVSVIDRGRLLESELPPRWAKQIKATPAGKVTRIQNDAKGVEMIAVCKKREVIGKGNGVDSSLLSGGGGGSEVSSFEKKYLAELKDRAVIERR